MRRTLEKDDVFYTAAVIEMAARKTHNRLSDIVRQVKLPYIAHVMQYANIDHCLPMNQVVTELIEDNHVQNGDFDAEGCCRYRVPSSKDIGKVYARLVTDLERDPTRYPKTLCDVLSSEISEEISNFNASWYYAPRGELLHHYRELCGGTLNLN